MDEIIKVHHKPFFFVPQSWTDIFTDTVIDTYVDFVKINGQVDNRNHPVPFGFQLTEEDEIVQLVEKITCDIEYGVHYPEGVCFESDEDYDLFQGICQDNLYFSIHDINEVLNRYYICYKLGYKVENMPIKGVW